MSINAITTTNNSSSSSANDTSLLPNDARDIIQKGMQEGFKDKRLVLSWW